MQRGVANTIKLYYSQGGQYMLSDNLKNLRKAKGLSQEELAVKLNVVRQTVSKWEQGLSVPDSEMLLHIATELDTTVNVLLGDTVDAEESSDLKTIAAKLEVLNEQFAKRNETRRKVWRAIFIAVGALALFSLIQMVIKVVWLQIVINSVGNIGDASIAIIGGADGPTSILVATVTARYGVIAVAAIVVIVAIVGICKTKRNS